MNSIQNSENKNEDTKRTVLVAEDDEFFREIVSLNLMKRGYQVLTAAEGQQAFKMVQENPQIELVLSDIKMPGGDGMELLNNIQTLNSQAPPVVLMTGFADVTPNEAKAAGAKTVITKPFQTEDLLQLIHGIFSNSGSGHS